MLKKISDMIEEAADMFFGRFQRQSLKLVEVVATAYYLQGVRLLRRHLLLLFVAIFCVVAMAVTAVTVPTAIVLVSPWTRFTKALMIAGIGTIFGLVPLCVVLCLFSDKAWMRFSGFQGIMDRVSELKEKNGSEPSNKKEKSA